MSFEWNDDEPMVGDFSLRGEVSYAMPKPVISEIPRERLDSIILCGVKGVEAVGGFCPVHESDACLSTYVRYNHVFETMEKNFKEAMVQTRRDVS